MQFAMVTSKKWFVGTKKFYRLLLHKNTSNFLNKIWNFIKAIYLYGLDKQNKLTLKICCVFLWTSHVPFWSTYKIVICIRYTHNLDSKISTCKNILHDNICWHHWHNSCNIEVIKSLFPMFSSFFPFFSRLFLCGFLN